jgi:hypothetical protein
MAAAKRWVAELEAKTEAEKASGPVFSFTYDSRPAAELIPRGKQTSFSRTAPDGRVKQIKTYTDPATGLEALVESAKIRR